MRAVLPIVCVLLDMVTSYRGVFPVLRSLVSYLAAGIMRRISVLRAWASPRSAFCHCATISNWTTGRELRVVVFILISFCATAVSL